MPAPLTPEAIAQLIHLENIFCPHAREQREEKAARDNGPEIADCDKRTKFAHYTTAESALKIIASKRLWMRSTTCMADYREVEHGYEMLLNFFKDSENKKAFCNAVNSCAAGAAEKAIGLFDQWWQRIRFNTYITSVSDHDSPIEDDIGRLSMWRAFGGVQPRVALVFSIPWYSGAAMFLGLTFSPVAYLRERKVHDILNAVIANVTRECDFLQQLPADTVEKWVFQMLLAAVTCLKHEGFHEEREWRGVFTHMQEPTLLESSIEVCHGVPQKIFKIPLDKTLSSEIAELDMSSILDRVIIGPTSFPWVMYEAFVDALTEIGVSNPGARVVASNIPIRG